ncbi:hypothetical protein [Candidatus Macondimonas diazotrophica]|jgi:hypothetical protein|uniref:Uncharacterized protein n=1 Tax=Candidatus Macondimonas diazotrophica TaxID=2305248 RepID=A0A4Z0F8T3_9GAMM|nr:hypothetical protein [Candidatus Macondimonas diazotrophica]TFZ81693.1 hypothetical protein E4680_11525 [Candidatus Macondimonas diazotrophica]
MLPYLLSEKSASAVIAFYREAIRLSFGQQNFRNSFRKTDMDYLRTLDLTEEQFKAKYAQELGDPTKFQNVILPVVMPQVEEALAFQQEVFLSGTPIFGAVAPPIHMNAASQMDAIILDQQIKARWVPELLKTLRNGLKYNFGPTEIADVTQVSYSIEDVRKAGKRAKEENKEILWLGNKIKSLDPYNTIFDPRVNPTDLPTRGEFAGYSELYPRTAFKAFAASLPFRTSMREALESRPPALTASNAEEVNSFYVPDLDPCSSYINDTNPLYNAGSMNWFKWVGIADPENQPRINYTDMYVVTTLYGRILPEDFGIRDVPGINTPQIWKFIIVNGSVVIYAERLTNMHNLIPIIIGVPKDDGLGYQSKSVAHDVQPFQALTTALANSVIAARRRAISDRLLFDPLKISPSSIRSDSPVARIPVRLGPLGGTIKDAVHQLPFNDAQSQYAAQNINLFLGLADQTTGLNPARRGQFVKGNKTRFEFAETMSGSTSRDRTMALALEGNLFQPIKQILKANILQFQGASSIFNSETQEVVEVDPVLLRKANIEFKLSDGMLPSDKMIDGETLTAAFQVLSQSPELASNYNLGPMFSYLMNSRGAKLRNFEKSPEQVAYEQAVQAWQQAALTLAQSLTQMENPPTPEELQKYLPPQPTPQDFNYTPGVPTNAISPISSSVMQQYKESIDKVNQARAQAGNNANVQQR